MAAAEGCGAVLRAAPRRMWWSTLQWIQRRASSGRRPDPAPPSSQRLPQTHPSMELRFRLNSGSVMLEGVSANGDLCSTWRCATASDHHVYRYPAPSLAGANAVCAPRAQSNYVVPACQKPGSGNSVWKLVGLPVQTMLAPVFQPGCAPCADPNSSARQRHQSVRS